MKTKKVNISDLRMGCIRDQVLPDGFIERVKAYKAILSEVETSSLEVAVSNFQRDVHPERELAVWENIAEVYQSFISENPIKELSEKRKVFSIILGASMGVTDFSSIKLGNC